LDTEEQRKADHLHHGCPEQVTDSLLRTAVMENRATVTSKQKRIPKRQENVHHPVLL
jgi:hypothetical protein